MEFHISEGRPEPLGLSIKNGTANFAVFSQNATEMILGLFYNTQVSEIKMNRTENHWHIAVHNIPENTDYAFRCMGPYDEQQGHFFKPDIWLQDPYAKMIHKHKAKVALPGHFDWETDKSPKIPLNELVIYEMHVRGFTKHSSSNVSKRGTYLGLIEKIPYLKELGVNAVELMPVAESDQTHCKNIDPQTKKGMVNYWGYDPFHFFVPKYWYADADPVTEFKEMVRELHKNHIEVIIDVVYNHTGEGSDKNYYINFRGLDNSIYYMFGSGHYLDFTGCGNSLNANHPVVERLILDSMRYWIEEFHIDGFRFDLASVLTRDPKGKPLAHPPVIEAMAKDPVISKVKLIAESWDCAGLYQLGVFPKWGPWSEWNGRFRDVTRRFIKGTDGKAGFFANVLTGSEMVYRCSKTPLSSINFVTSHDGFSLHDLVSYNQKHNQGNGEGNRDGMNDNDSWNCGAEGPTDDENIKVLRERQMRNFFLALFLAQGIPMLLMGDEYGHTRKGNNNPFVQDNEINWFLWDELEKKRKIFNFVKSLISFRKGHTSLRRTTFFTPDQIHWHSTNPFHPDWSSTSRFVAFNIKTKPSLYVAFNANHNPVQIQLPPGYVWHKVVNTEEDWVFHGKGEKLGEKVGIKAYGALLAME